jgi:hypothetical protein
MYERQSIIVILTYSMQTACVSRHRNGVHLNGLIPTEDCSLTNSGVSKCNLLMVQHVCLNRVDYICTLSYKLFNYMYIMNIFDIAKIICCRIVLPNM